MPVPPFHRSLAGLLSLRQHLSKGKLLSTCSQLVVQEPMGVAASEAQHLLEILVAG